MSQISEKSEATNSSSFMEARGCLLYGIKQHCWSVTANVGVGRAHWWDKQGLVPFGVGALGTGLGI